MNGNVSCAPKSGLPLLVHTFEESLMAVLLGLMTLVTFINVLLRYGFQTSLIWGLEVTLILFAWLIIFGISFGFKVTTHLGVDAMTNLFRPKTRKVFALISAIFCLIYAFLLTKGAWDYWAPFAGLQPTEGRWFPFGFTDNIRGRAFYETDQVPMLEVFRFLEALINNDEPYQKMPRVIPYFILPVGTMLMLYRIIQATIGIYHNERESLIVSHEVEEAVKSLSPSDTGS